MDMPKTIKVGPHTYSVLRKTKFQMPEQIGGCDFDALQLSIRQRIKKSVAQETLLHELIHACTSPSFNEKTMTDEEFVTAVSPMLLQVLKENPELVEYLTK